MQFLKDMIFVYDLGRQWIGWLNYDRMFSPFSTKYVNLHSYLSFESHFYGSWILIRDVLGTSSININKFKWW